MNDRWYERLGGRKFLICAGFGIVFCLMFQFGGELSETAFEFLMGGTVIVYAGSNVGQKAITKKPDTSANAPTPASGTSGQ